jgi:hypothetical protein
MGRIRSGLRGSAGDGVDACHGGIGDQAGEDMGTLWIMRFRSIWIEGFTDNFMVRNENAAKIPDLPPFQYNRSVPHLPFFAKKFVQCRSCNVADERCDTRSFVIGTLSLNR